MSFLKKLLGGGNDKQPQVTIHTTKSPEDLGNLADVVKQALDLQTQFQGQVGQDYSQMSSGELMKPSRLMNTTWFGPGRVAGPWADGR
jgi:hypothetical protein